MDRRGTVRSDWRAVVKQFLLRLLILTGTASPVVAQTVPVLPFESQDPLKLPADIYLGEVAGVAVNSKGHIFVFSRGNSTGPSYMAAAAQLLEFDAAGKFIREIGKNLYAWSFAHAVRIDKYDNIWTVDKGSDTIIKFDPQGRVQYIFGRKGEASHLGLPPDTARQLNTILQRAGMQVSPPPPFMPTHTDGQFNQPTDVAWDANDNAYFSDGYVNSRIGKADKRGQWVMSWGSAGKGDGQFNTPHAIAVSPSQEVFVGDRGNNRIQVFDTNGKYVRQFTVDVPIPADAKAAINTTPSTRVMNGFPDAMCMTPGPNPVIFAIDLFPGRLYKLSLDGKVLGIYGQSGKNLGEFGWGHAIACPSENEVYVGELLNWRVQKLVTKGSRPATARSGGDKPKP
jgi:DNA-binding beta-propeller fold protein YncE